MAAKAPHVPAKGRNPGGWRRQAARRRRCPGFGHFLLQFCSRGSSFLAFRATYRDCSASREEATAGIRPPVRRNLASGATNPKPRPARPARRRFAGTRRVMSLAAPGATGWFARSAAPPREVRARRPMLCQTAPPRTPGAKWRPGLMPSSARNRPRRRHPSQVARLCG